MKYLIKYKESVSGWIEKFEDVQSYMNGLEKKGIVSNVFVQRFENDVLNQELVYDWNGQEWEKRYKVFFTKAIQTEDGQIIAKVIFSERMKEFQIFIDGAFYGASKNLKDLELEFNNL